MASKAIQVEIKGLQEAVAVLQQMGPRATESIGVLLRQFADTKVVMPAKELVPVVTGNLKGSIQALEPELNGTRVSVKVVAGNAAYQYALAVHENPRSGKTGGVSPSGRPYKTWSTVGQWKYLEIPALAAAKESAQWLANGARAIMKTWRG